MPVIRIPPLQPRPSSCCACHRACRARSRSCLARSCSSRARSRSCCARSSSCCSNLFRHASQRLAAGNHVQKVSGLRGPRPGPSSQPWPFFHVLQGAAPCVTSRRSYLGQAVWVGAVVDMVAALAHSVWSGAGVGGQLSRCVRAGRFDLDVSPAALKRPMYKRASISRTRASSQHPGACI